MPSGFENVMNTPQTAIGKGTVGEPPPAPAGKEGVIIRVAVFFDGTKNNRTNTAKRLRDPDIVKVKGGGSSYGNFYSNPAIHEFMNKRNDPAKHEVSHYVEGIGTNDFSEEAKAAGLSDKKNGNDDLFGNGFGAGTTGIREKVTKGINELRSKISTAYEKEDEYIEKIMLDVFGFSRGAAAARHFVYRHHVLHGPWPNQGAGTRRPELVVNFVGLYDTVSSFALGVEGYGSLAKVLIGSRLNTDRVFCNDVQELGLDMGALPQQVVHLAAGDEHRQNFSLTNINSTLAAGKGVELTLPGVHSDIGGSYVEPGQGELNKEERHVRNASEKQRLIEEGWYTPEQFVVGPPTKLDAAMAVIGQGLSATRNGAVVYPETWVKGVRYLTNEYQYVALRIMHHFAIGQHGGEHEPMDLASFDGGKFATYRVPADLEELAQHLESQALTLGRAPAAPDPEHHPNGTPPAAATCRTWDETKWLRNRYLHRSAKQSGDAERMGMEARESFGGGRLVIPDNAPDYLPPSLAKTRSHAEAAPAGD